MDSQPIPNVYAPIQPCESDDSRSSTSHSEEVDIIPGIIYTSDDSADVGQSDSTYADSDGVNYIAQYTNVNIGDETSRQLLLDSTQTSPQPSPQIGAEFIAHPLSPLDFTEVPPCDPIEMAPTTQCLTEKLHLTVPSKPGTEITRSNSSSTISTERSETESSNETQNFLSEYQRLASYPDEPLMPSLNYNKMYDDPIKTEVINDQSRWFVGSVHIDAKYRDAFYVHWNWSRIRQSFAFLHLAFLVVLLCIGIGLLVQMPRGKECDPVQQWWQGSVAYEIYVPSFQDSDGDGIGDIHGIISRLDYLENLGVRSIQLSSLFDTGFDGNFRNLRMIPSSIGHQHDVQLLAALLHERDMFLILELPLVSKGLEPKPLVDLIEEVPGILTNWTLAGVDGFVFDGLETISSDPILPKALRQWRHTIDHSKRNFNQRIIALPLDLLEKMKLENTVDVTSLLPLVDLLIVHFDVTKSAQELAKFIDESTEWDSQASYPWMMWKVGGIGRPRLADLIPDGNQSPMKTLGITILQLFLPGSVSVFYGDEISLKGAQNKDIEWASIMQWSSELPNAGFTSGTPWMSLSSDWATRNVQNLNASMSSVRHMIKASQTEVPIYINGIFDYEGDYHPTKSTNYKIRRSSENLLVVDRFYPRRNKYAVAINLANTSQHWDLSRLYFCGNVLASSNGKEGDVNFRNLTLDPGESVAFVLD